MNPYSEHTYPANEMLGVQEIKGHKNIFPEGKVNHIEIKIEEQEQEFVYSPNK